MTTSLDIQRVADAGILLEIISRGDPFLFLTLARIPWAPHGENTVHAKDNPLHSPFNLLVADPMLRSKSQDLKDSKRASLRLATLPNTGP